MVFFFLNEFSGETINSEEENESSRNREVSPTQGPTLPILQKVIHLSNKIQVQLLSCIDAIIVGG
jgi:kinesin family protein C2/C3